MHAGAVYMLPSSIATGPFSLRLAEECCALSIGVVLNADGSLGDTTITPSSIRVTARMTFQEVDQVLLGGPAELKRHPQLQALQQVSTGDISSTAETSRDGGRELAGQRAACVQAGRSQTGSRQKQSAIIFKKWTHARLHAHNY